MRQPALPGHPPDRAAGPPHQATTHWMVNRESARAPALLTQLMSATGLAPCAHDSAPGSGDQRPDVAKQRTSMTWPFAVPCRPATADSPTAAGAGPDSPTGAVGIYQRAGFSARHEPFAIYQKPLAAHSHPATSGARPGR